MKSSFIRTLVADLIALLLGVGPIVATVTLTVLVLQKIENIFCAVLAAPFLIVFSFIAVVFILRLILPPLKKGVYPLGFNWGFLGWLTHSMLTRSARIFGLHYLLHSVGVFRWLYWRALGAKVSYKISTSYKITLHDLKLIEIEEGVILAEDVELSGHIVRGDRVLVAPVRIGKNTFIGRGTYVGPRTTIGENCWIGMHNNVTGDVLSPGSKIANHEWVNGNPKRGSFSDNLE